MRARIFDRVVGLAALAAALLIAGATPASGKTPCHRIRAQNIRSLPNFGVMAETLAPSALKGAVAIVTRREARVQSWTAVRAPTSHA